MDMHARIDRRDIDGAAGLKEDRITGITQSGHQWETLRLGERLTARDLHETASIGMHLCQDVIERRLVPSVKGVVGIAPGAAERTAGQSYKHTGLPGVTRLTLNTMEDLGHSHVKLMS